MENKYKKPIISTYFLKKEKEKSKKKSVSKWLNKYFLLLYNVFITLVEQPSTKRLMLKNKSIFKAF